MWVPRVNNGGRGPPKVRGVGQVNQYFHAEEDKQRLLGANNFYEHNVIMREIANWGFWASGIWGLYPQGGVVGGKKKNQGTEKRKEGLPQWGKPRAPWENYPPKPQKKNSITRTIKGTKKIK